jgi:hypothetical protein
LPIIARLITKSTVHLNNAGGLRSTDLSIQFFFYADTKLKRILGYFYIDREKANIFNLFKLKFTFRNIKTY